MDNITQWVIGWWIMEKVVGEPALGANRWQRNKAVILGGLISNIPDLDIFISKYIPHKDYMSEFLFHRSLSHSVFFNIVVAIIVGWICGKTDRYKRGVWRWILGSYLSILLWHLLVDAMTSYGGRYLLPFSTATYSFDNIFVIDFFYTIPLIIIWFIYVSLRKPSTKKIIYLIGAAWVLIYPAFTFFAKNIATHAFQASLSTKGISYNDITTSPEPLQAFLWRGVVRTTTGGYYEWYYSLFDDRKKTSQAATHTGIDWRFIGDNFAIRHYLSGRDDVPRVEQWARWRTSYGNAGSGNAYISVVKQWGILWWERTNQWFDGIFSFIVNATGEVIGQWGRGRFLEEPFVQVWKKHRKRVFGNIY